MTGGPGTIHVAYGRRFGGSTEGYRTVALTQHSSAAIARRRQPDMKKRRRFRGAAPLKRGEFDSGGQWPFLCLPALAACSLGLRSPRFAAARSAFLASRAAVRSALAASCAAVRSALAVSRARVRSALSAARSAAAAAFSVFAASRRTRRRQARSASAAYSRRPRARRRSARPPPSSVGVFRDRLRRLITQVTSWWAIQLT